MLFSVVVPVYNVENYVSKCLETLINQTFKDFELIIVNDGATDCSLSICKEYAKKDKRIRIITQENKGLAIARRTGALKAKGDYIVNVDSDDWVDENYLEEMANIINNCHVDVVCMNHYENDDKLIQNANFNDIILDKEGIKKVIYPYLIRNVRYEYFRPTAWAKAFKRELFTNNTCTTRIQVGEDGAVICPIIVQSNNIYLSSKAYYHYRISDGSMIQNKKPRNYSDVINVYNHLKDKLGDDFEKFKLQVDRLICHLAFNCSITQFYGDRSYKEAKKIILENLNNPIISEAIKHIDSKGFKGNLLRYSLKHHRIYLMKLYSYIM
ncbi:MAG: glycosyltransferase [Bacilli bacterium]|nr:glycosyltransferase [Bacilli bacterium]